MAERRNEARGRLLAVVNDFPAPSQTFIHRKLTGLRDVGWDVSVAASHFHPGAAETGLDLVPMISSRPDVGTLRAAGPGAVLRSLGSIAASAPDRSAGPTVRGRVLAGPLRSAAADIVHFEFSGIAASLVDLLPSLRPARLAVSCRGAAEQVMPLVDPRRAEALAAVFAQVDLVHCVSDEMRRTVEALGAPPDRILVNRPAVPVGDFAPLAARGPRADGPLRVLSIGRLHWKKGLDDGVRAVGRLLAGGRPALYRIAGEGPEREKLTFLRSQLRLEEAVDLLGRQDQRQIREHLGWADVLLLPSLSEGISNAVLEAMAAGLPVVTTDCGGMTEAVDDGVEGFIVPIGDIDAMATRLGQLADAPPLARKLGEAAAGRAAAEFDLSRQIRLFDDAYRSL